MDYSSAKDKLLEMAKKDQAIIKNADEFKEIAKNNSQELDKIIAEIGWPTISKVGEEASEAAWLIAQHSDQDIEFQKKCLGLIESELADVHKQNFAYLFDRISVNNGSEKQKFGTQTKKENGIFTLIIPAELNGEELDSLRRSYNLPPLKEYLDLIARFNS